MKHCSEAEGADHSSGLLSAALQETKLFKCIKQAKPSFSHRLHMLVHRIGHLEDHFLSNACRIKKCQCCRVLAQNLA